MPTSITTTRLDRLTQKLRDVDVQLQMEGDFIPPNIDIVGFRTQRDEPILLVWYAGETFALRDEVSYNAENKDVPGFLDRSGDLVAACNFGPLRLYRLGVALYNMFMDEVENLDGAPRATETLVAEVKAALRQVSGFSG